MIKKFIAILVLSTLIIFGMSYAQQAIQLLINAHEWISQLLTDVFTAGQAGNLARGLLALLSIPILAGLIPALLYWMIRRHWYPYFMDIVWIVWLVQTGALLMMYKTAGV
jgi:hypothetical protein